MESRAGDGPKLSGDEENLRQYDCDNQNMQRGVFRDRRAHGRGAADPYATEVAPIGAAAGRRGVAETAHSAGLLARTWPVGEPNFIN